MVAHAAGPRPGPGCPGRRCAAHTATGTAKRRRGRQLHRHRGRRTGCPGAAGSGRRCTHPSGGCSRADNAPSKLRRTCRLACYAPDLLGDTLNSTRACGCSQHPDAPNRPADPLLLALSSASSHCALSPACPPPADGPAEVRRQLQAIAPELTLTQPPAGRPAAGAPPAAAAAQRPAGVADRAAAQGLLARMHQLQAEAAALLQEQAAGARCSGAAAAFRGLAALGPAASEGSSSGGTPAERQKAAAAAAAAPQRGPSPAVAERLARLRKLQAQGAALAAGVA